MPSLFQELKRRLVFRVAVVYAIVGWLLVQIASVTFPALNLPAWGVTLVLALVLLGFPVALLLTWAFEITPEGVRRTAPTEDSAPSSRRLAGVLALGVLGALAVLSLLRWGPGARRASEAVESFPTAASATDPDSADESRARSIAVLPFDHLSGDPEDQWFTDGITDDVLTALSKIEDLHVISRTSSMAYRDTGKTLREIAGELGVGTVLEGSVRRQENRIRITAQLIDAASDRHLWAETFDRDATDLFAIQTEIAEAIAAALQAELSPIERTRILAGGTRNLNAYELYLRGREELNRGEQEEPTERAIAYFGQALALDPDYALAHAGLAMAYARRQAWRGVAWGDSALVAAVRAIALEPEAAEGYEALAVAQYWWGLEDLAYENFRLALARNPNSPMAVRGVGAILEDRGRYDEALPWILRAAELEPTVPPAIGAAGGIYLDLEMYDQALRWYERRRDLAPEDPESWLNLWWVHVRRGDLDRAEEAVERAARIDPQEFGVLSALGQNAMARGRYAEAVDALGRGQAEVSEEWVPRTSLGMAYWHSGELEKAEAALRHGEEMARLWIARGDQGSWAWNQILIVEATRGDLDAAVEALARGIAAGDLDGLYQVRYWPAFEPLRRDSRARRLLADYDEQVARMRERVEREGTGLRRRG